MELYTRPSASSEIDKLAVALSKARPSFKQLHNNRKANYGGYADIMAIYYATIEACEKYEIGVCHYRTPVGKDILMCTRIMHAGQWIEDSAWLSIPDDPKINKDQASGKSQSYNKRYALYNLLGIVSINDKDDNDYEDYRESEYQKESIKIQPPSKKITVEQEEQLQSKLKDHPNLAKDLLGLFKVDWLKDIPVKDTQDYIKILNWCDRNIAALNK